VVVINGAIWLLPVISYRFAAKCVAWEWELFCL
jgi:hypothetical protein